MNFLVILVQMDNGLMHFYAGIRVLLLIDSLFLHIDCFFSSSTLMGMKFVLVINFEM